MSIPASPASLALLITDAVDSTRTAERLGDVAMGHWWAIHDRLARDLLAAWRGREIDKSDGMLMLFDRIDDAAGYALAYQQALEAQRLPFKVRAGLHLGQVTLRHTGPEDVARGAKQVEVFGLALPVTARVMSAARGGQTLLSAEAARALALTGSTIRLHSHGHWRMQGMAEPIEIFEAGDDATVFHLPSDGEKVHRVVRQGDHWLPVEELGNSLPAERNSFVGRVDAVDALSGMLGSGARLVSVLGIGGTGKTRLAMHVARDLLHRYSGGIWFCDLSAARTIEGIHFAVAKGLDVSVSAADPSQQLAMAISGRGRCLLVLDNFEQVTRHAEATLGVWLDQAPRAQFLVTTREVLSITGEQILALAPLNADDAAELFRHRAAAARHGYAPDAADETAISQLVAALDGLPLAIELAAARTRTLSPKVLVTRMRDRLDVLFSRGTRHDRQATLRATLDWSWELLGDPEKQALATLAVFEGGFTLEAAAAVFEAAWPQAMSADDMVSELLDKSWLRHAGDERFGFLEIVREYVAAQLRNPGCFEGRGAEIERLVRAAHWRHFATIGESAATAAGCAEAHNLVAACRAATDAGEAQAAGACLTAAWAALVLTGPYRVGLQLAEALAIRGELSAADRAHVHCVAAESAELLGDREAALGHIEVGLRSAEQGQAPVCRARLMLVKGERLTFDGQPEAAHECLLEAARLADALHEPRLQMLASNKIGLLMDHQSRWNEARDCYERALHIARGLGDRRLEGGILGNLGGLHHDRGDLAHAQSAFEQALELATKVGDRQWGGTARCNLGLVLQEQGRHDLALPQFEQALQVAREVGHVRLEYTVLCNLGILLAADDRHDEAGVHLNQAVAAARAVGDRRAEGLFSGYLAVNLARRGAIEAAREALGNGEKLLTEMSDRLSQALLLCDRFEVELLAGRTAVAGEALLAAQRLAHGLGCGPESELGRRVTKLAGRSALPETIRD